MKITINDHRKIYNIQKEFTEKFPYLRIEFFSKTEENSERTMNACAWTVGECRSTHESGTIIILPQMTVAELEQIFRNMYGLSIQIFRKSGMVWLETTVTNSWTLEEQNRQGEALSNIVI